MVLGANGFFFESSIGAGFGYSMATWAGTVTGVAGTKRGTALSFFFDSVDTGVCFLKELSGRFFIFDNIFMIAFD